MDELEKLSKKLCDVAPHFAPFEYIAMTKVVQRLLLSARLEEVESSRHGGHCDLCLQRIMDLQKQLTEIGGGL